MKQFIPLEKQSKKAKRAEHQRKRKSWNGVNPVTKKDIPKTVYSRKRTRRRNDEHFSGGFVYAVFYYFSSACAASGAASTVSVGSVTLIIPFLYPHFVTK